MRARNNLIKARESLGLNKVAFAHLIGISQGYLTYIEDGRRDRPLRSPSAGASASALEKHPTRGSVRTATSAAPPTARRRIRPPRPLAEHRPNAAPQRRGELTWASGDRARQRRPGHSSGRNRPGASSASPTPWSPLPPSPTRARSASP